MKNIETILAEAGIELTEEQKAAVLAGVKENYKTAADYQKQTEKVAALQASLDETTEALKQFEGVKPEELNAKIAELTKAVADKETEYNEKIAQRDFDDLITNAISSAKGKNAVAIKALLKLDELKASKNQKDDIAAAVKKLTEAEDSKMLFGEPEPNPAGTGDLIGTVRKDGTPAPATMQSALADHYKTK